MTMPTVPPAPRVGTLLVVEDSATQRLALTTLLEEAGWATHGCATAEAALDVLAEGRLAVHLVLSDIVLPGMSGYELCRWIRASAAHRDLPVVLLTSRREPAHVMHGLESGADTFITKPYSPTRLVERVGRLLARAAAPVGGATPCDAEDDAAAVDFLGREYRVASGRQRILDICAATIEELVMTNRELRDAEASLEAAVERERGAREAAERAHIAAEAARAEAEAASRARAQFLATMSHDLRTPLTAIAGYVHLLKIGLRGPLTDAQRDDLGRIERNQGMLVHLVNEALDYVRSSGESQPTVTVPIAVDAIVEALPTFVGPQVEAAGLTLVLGAAPSALTLRGHREYVDQVLVNLLANAIKFTARGGTIHVTPAAESTRIGITVADTGTGIDPALLPTIFEPFVRGAGAERHHGAGLGLAISRNLARRMGGDIEVTSTVGVGSRFTLWLPRAPETG